VYVREHSVGEMTLAESREDAHVGVYSVVYEEDDLRIYPDSIEIKVALDQGDILGVSAKNYFMHHHDRDIPEPNITKEEAKKNVNPNIDIQEENEAIIENELGEEVLTYEFIGVLDQDTYRIFINADHGQEEQVEKLGGTETNYAGS